MLSNEIKHESKSFAEMTVSHDESRVGIRNESMKFMTDYIKICFI